MFDSCIRSSRRLAMAIAVSGSVSAVVLGAQPLAAQAPAAPAPPAAAGVTAAQAAPFLGDWTVTAESPMGPAVFALSVKSENGKVTAKVSSDQMAETEITDITKADASLVLKYSFDFQGSAVPAEVTLTPAADKLTVNFSFADGQFEMTGTGTKKA